MLVIYCAGEQGRVVLDILRRQYESPEVAFIDDDEERWGATVEGVPVIGGRSALDTLDPEEDRCIVAYGDSQSVRGELATVVREREFDLFTALAPSAVVSERATVSNGCIINEQSYVGPGAELSDIVLLDSLVNVSHDVSLARGVTVGPNATLAGGVTVGQDAFVGAGTTVLDDVSIEAGATVGAGAVVTDHVPEGETVIGVPAEPISNTTNN